MSVTVRLYRLVVFLLAGFYFVDRFAAEGFVWDNFGWQFRYMTIWALTLSLISAAMMLIPYYGRRGEPGSVFVSVTAIANMLVVFSYWRLYFQDPAMVNGGRDLVPYREYYLHLAGPLLQWFDVLFLKRGFRSPMRIALWLAVMVVLYVEWVEFIIRPLNDDPVGTITTGLPYPFLNDMSLADRGLFYLSVFVTGLVFILIFRVLQLLIMQVGRWRPA